MIEIILCVLRTYYWILRQAANKFQMIKYFSLKHDLDIRMKSSRKC